MKPTPLLCPLLLAATAFLSVAAFLAVAACAAPRADAQTKRHKPSSARSQRQPHSVRRSRPTGRAYILNAARPGVDPNRGDHMAFGRGMHPERMDHMNVTPPVPPAPTIPKRLPKP